MRSRDSRSGQAMVEFALVLILFVLLVMGVLDFGRGIFTYNGLSQAAREIARVASVHPGNPLGSSTEALAVIERQERLVPNLNVEAADFTCEDINGNPVTGACLAGNWVRVSLKAEYAPVTPPLALLIGTLDLASTSSVQITNN